MVLPSADISPMKRWLKPGPSDPNQSSPGARHIVEVEPSTARQAGIVDHTVTRHRNVG
jgi:hypothetical protein